MYVIDEKTTAETKCESFNCLNTENAFCKSENYSANMLFVDGKYTNFCSYKLSFGNSFICRCPTREAIFHKYKI